MAKGRYLPFIMGFAGLTLLLTLSLVTLGKARKLNLLLITIDTLRPDFLGCYSSKAPATPNINALAARGVQFSRAFAHTPTTLPSHTNILLGASPPFHGVHDNANFLVRAEFITLAEWLKERGYATAAFVGAFPLDSRFGLHQGFDVYDDNYGTQGPQDVVFVERRAEVVIDQALAWLRQQDGPWFCWVHCFDPHQRYDPPEPFRTQYRDNLYAGEVAYVDFALGRLFSFLEESKGQESTLVVFTGDHGESLGEHGEMTHGYFAYNSTLWVPLLIYYPRVKPQSIAENVSHVDIFPTVCDILGLETPAHVQGSSMLPLMEGKKFSPRPIYFESLTAYCNRGWAPVRGYIEGSLKYIDSPIPEIYDLTNDFHEATNLAEKEDVRPFQLKFDRLMAALSPPGKSEAKTPSDRETREKLRSLGYIASLPAPAKKAFTREDDLKVLLPFHSKWMRAMVLHQQGKTEQAIALLRDIIAQRKDFDLAYTYLGNYYKDQKKFKEAQDILEEAYRYNPQSFRILVAYAIFLIDRGKYDDALLLLEKAKSLVDYDPEVWNYIGVAHWQRGDYERALHAYTQALTLDNNYPVVFNNLGSLYLSIYLKTRDPKANQTAIANFRQAIQFDPKYASAYNGLGAALKFVGDLDGAIENWEKAVELKPDYGYALYNLGLTYLAKGLKSQALVYFMRYKTGFYDSLSVEEKNKLDRLIENCRKNP